MLKNDNKCLVCSEVFHRKCWSSFGFCERDEELQMLVAKMELDALQKELK